MGIPSAPPSHYYFFFQLESLLDGQGHIKAVHVSQTSLPGSDKLTWPTPITEGRSKTCSLHLLLFPQSPSLSWYFFCRSWRNRSPKCLQRLNASKMRRGKRQTIMLGSRPGKWNKMGIPLFIKSPSWCWENKSTNGIWITTRTGMMTGILFSSEISLSFRIVRHFTLGLSELSCECPKWNTCILSLTSLLLCVCSKLSQRDKLLSLGRKKFNMDPEKVGFAHSSYEEKAVRKRSSWLLVHLQLPMPKELCPESVGLVSYLTKAPVSSTFLPIPE